MDTITEILVYHYHPDTGGYLGSSVADLDPVALMDDRVEPLVPAWSTLTAPPDESHLFDRASQVWVPAPVVEPVIVEPDPLPPPPPKTFTSLEFLDLFTEAEQLAVVQATMVQPVVKLWYDRMLAAGYITIADPRTGTGLDALVSAGLLTSDRRIVIIDALT